MGAAAPATRIRPPARSSTAAQFGHVRNRNLNATLSQTVLDFSKYANLKAAHSAANAQDEQYEAALQDLYVRVATAYFGVLTSEDALAYAKANEDAFRQQYDQSDQRFKVGLSAITDVYQAKAYYEAAKADTIAAQNALNDAREALTQITGQPTGDLKKLREDLPMDRPYLPPGRMGQAGAADQPQPAGTEGQRGNGRAQHQCRSRRPPADHQRQCQLWQERLLVRERRTGRDNGARPPSA